MSGNWNTWKWNNQNRKAQGQPRKGTQQASQRGGKGFQGGIPFLRWIIGLSFVYGSCYVLYGCLTTASAWYLAEAGFERQGCSGRTYSFDEPGGIRAGADQDATAPLECHAQIADTNLQKGERRN